MEGARQPVSAPLAAIPLQTAVTKAICNFMTALMKFMSTLVPRDIAVMNLHTEVMKIMRALVSFMSELMKLPTTLVNLHIPLMIFVRAICG
jgi:hypothetical protein